MVAYDMSLQSWKKPFNPLLGETWQAQQAGGGCQIFMEQLSHHPPISAFEMIGPGEPLTVKLLMAAACPWCHDTTWGVYPSCPIRLTRPLLPFRRWCLHIHRALAAGCVIQSQHNQNHCKGATERALCQTALFLGSHNRGWQQATLCTEPLRCCCRAIAA